MAKTPAVLLDPATFDGPSTDDPGAPDAQVTIKGRNVEVPDHFATRIHTKLAKIEKISPAITRFDVVLLHEKNPRLAKASQRIEITLKGKPGVARAEAAEDTFYAALESAVAKLERQMRKARTRRKISHSGHRRPQSVAEATAELAPEAAPADVMDEYADGVDDQLPGQIVRRKEHDGTPMSVDEALEKMELVGHDFYLFRDTESGNATVVYRRHAFDYGLITLSDEA
ncbi:MAG: ribosome-associated translation inhibitor RaiA [Dietzia sp.]|jgi:ribosomal subunit interface protein|uniref:Ribosome hibernation promoting factor n=1 Tax=Dietzia cercidiphylli TaxID=498199 RepID=A0ABN2II47_9ACTN|nr:MULTISPECIES: ribosome-associated translation inhibitor RaiA [Dietzia]MBB1040594.1 ribosome-associated translation inhibitor RaiA [Dietzia sp. Cai40]MBB1044187.1 ribosome-associated translation inhibitor RaiA [Dietzia sp. DQ11-44]MBB1048226.1 ribosome-associated translation inhibitor RaiA [Dietzia cercidiphylli]MBB1050877.1 ribosome-associated translation inhibitor RaiA [Dietzia sp. CW19]MBB1053132.1 ribosome-associated translation inhibitor RaiA [Dietzia sp. B44]